MSTDSPRDPTSVSFESGLLSPVSVGHDAAVSDAAVLDALVEVELALVRAYGCLGVAPAAEVGVVVEAVEAHALDPIAIARDAVAGGNPAIPLAAALRDIVPQPARRWVHRGATSQDVLDSALVLVSSRAVDAVLADLDAAGASLARLASGHRDEVAVARTLTQHAVPTTIGLRFANRLRALRRATERLTVVRAELPAQLGGAAGTLASFVELAGAEAAADLPRAFAAELGLAAPEAPWHTSRWPVTELGDALVQAIDALGALAADVTTLGRTEIGELSEGIGGGSSAMPQKRNPARSVLIRSAAIRAPQLGATLHGAAALAVDERPDGAWHAEWPTLRDLLRLALGAAANGRLLAAGLSVDAEAVARNLALTRGAILAERLALALGADAATELLDALASGSGGLAALLDARGLDPALADPSAYTGLAAHLVDAARSVDDPATPVPDPHDPLEPLDPNRSEPA
ncbi:3-carboxy-cis,cis-muconate cycloisomerase [Agromyces sp. CF514]|uniref:lyase family protein n=1 Tax=Agromyces sp. CF514 TaxID=1881031 RepID=UPI0008DF31BD|nr:lyase family protein [Agromyces sp. CF514]SFR67588.1 3-carboxy-cis,cis-muconate cycloisomerase [Agromyces sp. CF514]